MELFTKKDMQYLISRLTAAGLKGNILRLMCSKQQAKCWNGSRSQVIYVDTTVYAFVPSVTLLKLFSFTTHIIHPTHIIAVSEEEMQLWTSKVRNLWGL